MLSSHFNFRFRKRRKNKKTKSVTAEEVEYLQAYKEPNENSTMHFNNLSYRNAERFSRPEDMYNRMRALTLCNDTEAKA